MEKHFDVLQNVLSHNGLPIFPTWESEILDTTQSPFSERVMLFKHAALTSQAIARYGISLSGATRLDIGTDFLRLLGETAKYAEDSANLMIKHKFLDQLPLAKKVN